MPARCKAERGALALRLALLSVERLRSSAADKQRKGAAGDSKVFQQMIELVSVGDVGVHDQSRRDAESGERIATRRV